MAGLFIFLFYIGIIVPAVIKHILQKIKSILIIFTTYMLKYVDYLKTKLFIIQTLRYNRRITSSRSLLYLTDDI